MQYTIEDVELLARLLYSECRGEPVDGQIAVATVVMNRVQSPRYPGNIRDVIYQKHQFAKPSDYLDVKLLEVALDVVEGERNLPKNVVSFQRKRQNEWYGLKWWCQIGAHNFYG